MGAPSNRRHERQRDVAVAAAMALAAIASAVWCRLLDPALPVPASSSPSSSSASPAAAERLVAEPSSPDGSADDLAEPTHTPAESTESESTESEHTAQATSAPPPAPRPTEVVGGCTVCVVDDSERPVAGATVTTIDGERDLAVVRTDDAGIAAVTKDGGSVRVTAAGHWPTTTAVLATIGPCRITLVRAPRLRGSVFAADGTPHGGARVALLPTLDGRRGWPASLPPQAPVTSTDASGAFELPWPDANVHDLVATAPGAAPTVVAALRADPFATAPVVLVLAAPARLAGSARRADRPLPHARVEVWSSTWTGAPAAGASPWLVGQLLAATSTDATGAFAIEGLPFGGAWAVLPDEGGAAIRLELRAGALTTVQFEAALRATLAGELRPPSAGAELFLFASGRCLHTVRTTAEGAFTFPPVPPGRYLVGAAADPAVVHAVVQDFVLGGGGTGGQVVDLAAGETRRVIVAATTTAVGGISGQAFVAGQPAHDHFVVLESVPPVGARRRRAVVADGGAFHFASLAPGDYDAQLVRVDGRVLARSPCRVCCGGDTTLTLAPP